MSRAPLVALPVLVALVVSIAAAAPQQPEASATALVTRIVQPGLPDQVSLSIAGPPTAAQDLAGYAFPEDGSIVRVGSADASAGGKESRPVQTRNRRAISALA